MGGQDTSSPLGSALDRLRVQLQERGGASEKEGDKRDKNEGFQVA